MFFFILANGYQIKNYRFSSLENHYYFMFYDLNPFEKSCCIIQFTPVSDFKLLYQFNWILENDTFLQKGDMFYNVSDYSMNCFNLYNISDLCIQESAMHNEYIIFTNKVKTFHIGILSDFSFYEYLYERMLFYNLSQVKTSHCKYYQVDPKYL
jgi:hypothetical protein